jgi:hypothetical protein
MPVLRLPEACGLKIDSMLQQCDVTNKLAQARLIPQVFHHANRCLGWINFGTDEGTYLIALAEPVPPVRVDLGDLVHRVVRAGLVDGDYISPESASVGDVIPVPFSSFRDIASR